jgi:type 1 glutamine amidotransferase
MQPLPTRQALVVRGGWEGHEPVEATKRFIPFLEENGFDVEVSETLDVYLDAEKMARVDLVLQLWTMGETTAEHVEGLAAAVRAGAGLAGWHGGIVDSFRNHPEYLHMTGGLFATHPGGFRHHSVQLVPEKAGHPIVEGLPTTWDLYTEQYWTLTDAYNEVLATTTYHPADEPDAPWHRDVVQPAVWLRPWGKGRVFVSTIGHKLDDLDHPAVRTLTERGLLWASR